MYNQLISKLRIKDLVLLKEIASTRSLTSTAKRMGISQPAVTRMLADIERIFATELFLRNKSVGVVPTDAGDIVLSRADILLNDLKSLSNHLEEFQNGTSGHLRLGLIPYVSDSFIRNLVLELIGDAHRVSVSIHSAATDQLVSLMQASRLDAVIGRLNALPHSPELAHEKLFSQQACVVIHPANALLNRRQVDWKQLAGLTWLLPPQGSPTRAAFVDVFAARNETPPATIIETTSAKAIRALVSVRPDMIGLVPDDIGRDLESWGGVHARPFPEKFRMPTAGLIYPVKNKNLPTIRTLRTVLTTLKGKGLLAVL